MNDSIQLTDELLVRALVKRTSYAPSPRLLDRIVTAAASMPQERRGLPWTGRRTGSAGWPSLRVPALAGALVAIVAIVIIGLSARPLVGPGGTPTPLASPAPTPTVPASPRLTAPPPTPVAVLLGDVPAQRLRLSGGDAGPIDVTDAFGSIWTADIHANDVRRFNPATMEQVARIPVTGGPAWFAVADGALWVTNQNRTGLTRIDPATNTVAAHVGAAPPCGAPVVALAGIWQSACDGDVFLHIDPATNTVVDSFPAKGQTSLVFAGGALITTGPDGLARMDPNTGAFSPIGGSVTGGTLIGSDGKTVWHLADDGTVLRIDPSDGHTVATFAETGTSSVAFADGHAWLAVNATGIREIDLTTNQVLRTIPLVPNDIPHESGGVLWVTDFNNSSLWRLEP